MAKRFTHTDKWSKSWFRKLQPKHKCFWFYILDKCDIAGIWDADIESASFHIGDEITESEMLNVFGDKIVKISEDKFFIVSFIEFQYGQLKSSSPVHKKVIEVLEKYTLWDRVHGRVCSRVASTLQEKEKEEDKDKEEVEEKEEENPREKKNETSIILEMKKITEEHIPDYDVELGGHNSETEYLKSIRHQITKEIKKKIEAEHGHVNRKIEHEEILQGYRLILERLPAFYSDKFSLKIISNNFKSIFSDIKNSKNGSDKKTTGQRDYTDYKKRIIDEMLAEINDE